jgi:hypothetical protein
VTIDFKWQVVFVRTHLYNVTLCLYWCFLVEVLVNYFRINDFHKPVELFLAIRWWHGDVLKIGMNCAMNSFLFSKIVFHNHQLFIIYRRVSISKTRFKAKYLVKHCVDLILLVLYQCASIEGLTVRWRYPWISVWFRCLQQSNRSAGEMITKNKTNMVWKFVCFCRCVLIRPFFKLHHLLVFFRFL